MSSSRIPRIVRGAVPVLVAAGATLTWAGAAQAVLTTLVFSGSVSTVDATLAGTFHNGDAVSITVSYDPAALDLVPPNPHQAAYPYISFSLTFGNYSAAFGTQFPNTVGVLNDTDQGLGPSDGFGVTAVETGAGAPVGGLPLQQGFVTLWDFTQTAFSGTSLPVAPNFADFSLRIAGLTFCSNPGCGVGSGFSTAFAQITSMSAVTTVPEPPTAALLFCGFVLAVRGVSRRVA